MDLPIKCCSGCLTNYTWPEWKLLEKRTEREGNVEVRTCAACGGEMELSVDGLEDLNLHVDPERYAERHPHCSRSN
jgi:hypothetical protein